MNRTKSQSTFSAAFVPGWGPYQQVSGWSLIIAGGWLLLRGAHQLPALFGTAGWLGYLTVAVAAVAMGMKLLVGHRRRNRIRRTRGRYATNLSGSRHEFASAVTLGTGFLSVLLVLLIVTYLLV